MFFRSGTPPPLCLPRWTQHHLHDKMDQAFPVRFCILQTIKNRMLGRPGNEARVWVIHGFILTHYTKQRQLCEQCADCNVSKSRSVTRHEAGETRDRQHKHLILEPFNLMLEMKRNLSAAWFNEIPTIDITAKLGTLKVRCVFSV